MPSGQNNLHAPSALKLIRLRRYLDYLLYCFNFALEHHFEYSMRVLY